MTRHRQYFHVEDTLFCSQEIQNLKVKTDVQSKHFNSIENKGLWRELRGACVWGS